MVFSNFLMVFSNSYFKSPDFQKYVYKGSLYKINYFERWIFFSFGNDGNVFGVYEALPLK